MYHYKLFGYVPKYKSIVIVIIGFLIYTNYVILILSGCLYFVIKCNFNCLTYLFGYLTYLLSYFLLGQIYNLNKIRCVVKNPITSALF